MTNFLVIFIIVFSIIFVSLLVILLIFFYTGSVFKIFNTKKSFFIKKICVIDIDLKKMISSINSNGELKTFLLKDLRNNIYFDPKNEKIIKMFEFIFSSKIDFGKINILLKDISKNEKNYAIYLSEFENNNQVLRMIFPRSIIDSHILISADGMRIKKNILSKKIFNFIDNVGDYKVKLNKIKDELKSKNIKRATFVYVNNNLINSNLENTFYNSIINSLFLDYLTSIRDNIFLLGSNDFLIIDKSKTVNDINILNSYWYEKINKYFNDFKIKSNFFITDLPFLVSAIDFKFIPDKQNHIDIIIILKLIMKNESKKFIDFNKDINLITEDIKNNYYTKINFIKRNGFLSKKVIIKKNTEI